MYLPCLLGWSAGANSALKINMQINNWRQLTSRPFSEEEREREGEGYLTRFYTSRKCTGILLNAHIWSRMHRWKHRSTVTSPCLRIGNAVEIRKCNFAESLFCRKKISESHLTESSHGRIIELAKLHNAERHFSESLFSRTSFSRIEVQPNVIFTNLRSVERRFPETSFARKSFCRNCMKQNVISPNTK